jgi:hypothetical protein
MSESVFHRVEPLPELVSRLRGLVGPRGLSALTEPHVWESHPDEVFPFDDRPEGWGDAEDAALTKLVFLAGMHADALPKNRDEVFAQAFSTDRFSVALFDRFWTITRLPPDEAEEARERVWEYLERLIGSGRYDPTGNQVVDRWLEEQERKYA